ncbi:class I SAM-dependent methyltransferase [Amycolatopsis viridis]|uniref:class I SAM-dependent methyltransferase n=1 Tax=Amycolatopsis viridis TaxID=185678 RepID=UPI0028BF08B6|nr:class I SAM-dependent methyltransferase [Amycolatopsis viridis]
MAPDRWDGAGPGTTRCAPDWLALREPADAAARAAALLGPLRASLSTVGGRLVIRDVGCGTGSMARWLAPRLPVPQHWILHDRDPALLARASITGTGVTVETHHGDLGRLDLGGTSLVTASALLDLLTLSDVDGLAGSCAAAGCPALLTLSVTGRVELTPADPLDAEIAAAFAAHQRRNGLLGPDAVAMAALAFERRGAVVRLAPSPWRLGPRQRALTERWFRGWVAAAREHAPNLDTAAYTRSRLDACAAGELRAVVHHTDLLATGAS